jgi:predicted CXXCH cytochrome family protein
LRKIAIILPILACFFLVFYGNGYARVSGVCSNCHTMHNSQDGTAMAKDDSGNPASTSYIGLTLKSCLGCHSSTVTNEAISSIGAPIVYTAGGPDFGFDDGTNKHGLAGGNFYWVLTDDEKGHNVFASNPEDTIPGLDSGDGEAPGWWTGCKGNNSCHSNIHGTASAGTMNLVTSRQGCTKCHMVKYIDGVMLAPTGYHHADDTGPIIDTDAEGRFRFLDGHLGAEGRGVTGIEDPDWQATSSATDHNEYLGNEVDLQYSRGMQVLGNTMTGFCCGCHGFFHQEQNSSGTWIRHPSDAVIPSTGEYASAFGASSGTGTYDPQVPVARDDLSGGVSGIVTLDDDMVMCLSCHRAHGSPYNDMLRWDYDGMVAGSSGSGGCFTCHTQKNENP